MLETTSRGLCRQPLEKPFFHTDWSWCFLTTQHERTWREWILKILSSLQMMHLHCVPGETCAEQPRNVISDSPRVWRTGYTAIATASISERFISQKGIGSVDSGVQPHGPSSQVLSVEGGVQPMSRTSWSQFICWKLLDDLRDTCSLSTLSVPLVTFCLFYCIVLFKRFQAFSP